MDLARRALDGFFLAIMAYLFFSLSGGFAEVVTSGASAGATVGKVLQGR